MPHYGCTGGCLTVKYAPGQHCVNPGCPRFRNPLTECNCRNEKHGDLLYKNHPEREKILKELKIKAKKDKQISCTIDNGETASLY